MQDGHAAPRALTGVRVVSLAEQFPGPYCTQLLADLGADVILVERPDGGDPARGPDGSSPLFETLGRCKRSIVIDLKHASGAPLLEELLASADVLVEGFRPGVMERLGFGPEAVRGRHPRIVYCSISGYGQDGPYRERAGHDLSYQALAGLVACAGDPGSYRQPVEIGDLSSGMFAALAIVAALHHRQRGGQGQAIDVSMTDGLVSWMGPTLEPLLNDVEPPPRDPEEPAHGIFRCADGRYLSLSIAHEDHFWRNLCEVIGRPELAGLAAPERVRRRDELRALLEQQLATRPRDAWVDALARADVAAGPVLEPEEVLRDPQLVSRGLFRTRAVAGRPRSWVGHPVHFSVTPARPPSPAPALGEHTDEILAELGHGSGEIAALREAGAVGPRPVSPGE